MRTLYLAREVSQDTAHLKHYLQCMRLRDKSDNDREAKEDLRKKADLLFLERQRLNEKAKSLSKLRDDLIIKAMSKSTQVNSLRDKYDHIQEIKKACVVTKELKGCASDCMKLELSSISKVLSQVREAKAIKLLRGFKIATSLIHPSKKMPTEFISAVANPLVPPESKAKDKKQSIHLHGCSTIMGLPLPNNGFYDCVPLEILCSIMNLVARAVKLIADALNIAIPHPIDINEGGSDMDTRNVVFYPHDDRSNPILLLPAYLYPLTESLSSSSGSSSNKHIWHSISDVSANSSTSPWRLNTSFKHSITLLQANIIMLCIRIGIDPTKLWPPEGILLNINEILLFLLSKAKANASRGCSDINSEIPNSEDVILLGSLTVQLFGFNIFRDPPAVDNDQKLELSMPNSRSSSKPNSSDSLQMLAPGSPKRSSRINTNNNVSPTSSKDRLAIDTLNNNCPDRNIIHTPSQSSPDGIRRLRARSGEDAWDIIEDM